jgi:glycine oxidase
MAKVVIVGGGVIGCAIAERLSRDRHRVLLLERDRIAAHASGAAAGLLAPHSEAQGGGLAMGERSLAMFPELVRQVERSGIDFEYRAEETIRVALTPGDRRCLELQAGSCLDDVRTRKLEPNLSRRVRGSAVFAEAQVSPPRLVEALARTATAQGVEIREGTPVDRLVESQQRCGVRTANGLIETEVVVLAAGPWSGSLAASLGLDVPVRPSRGQLAMLRPRNAVLSRMLTWRGNYLVPKLDGTIVVGSTEEEAGFDARPTAGGLSSLLRFASAVVPALAGAPVERIWAALRPATPDGKPLIGPSTELPNLVLACGHNRTGILMAPLTAELVAKSLG